MVQDLLQVRECNFCLVEVISAPDRATSHQIRQEKRRIAREAIPSRWTGLLARNNLNDDHRGFQK